MRVIWFRRMVERPAVLTDDRCRSHAEIIARALRAAEGFRKAGVDEGHRIALLLRNDFAFFEASMGATFAGAYAVPLNWHSTADEAGYILRDCDARLLVAHQDLLPAIAAAIPAHVLVLIVETPVEIARAYGLTETTSAVSDATRWDDWLDAHAPIAAPDRANRAAVIYTSGTTGKPKGVRRAPDPGGRRMALAKAGYAFNDPEPKTVLMNGPMYHAAPNVYGRMALQTGADIILQPRFDAEEMLALIEQHRVTHMHIVPTMFVRLLRLPDDVRARYDLSSLRAVVHGAAPCPSGVKRAMIEWWGPVIHEYYGSSETGIVTGHNSEEALARPGTVGKPLPTMSIRILGEGGVQLPVGESGDIYVRSTADPDFDYIGLDGARDAITVDGFITVGDVGHLDADGYLYLGDRRRDMIISGGVNIYPAEIEAALVALDEIADCAVFGIPDEEFGEAVCAYLAPRDGFDIDPAAVRKRLATTLSRFKIPKIIKIVPELPREDSGKIFKRKLREPYWERRVI